ncbi:MAG: hypothetical protein PHR77_04275 [Kiritimatiellae bacterium]|nr:hypothetical protein [Kiritimatiellia bacterium]MDD5521408.1 hypothetical protein [Kiritimatiellia bacterium]
MNTGMFVGMSLVTSFLVAVGLPMAMGVFFRGFMKKSNVNVPALMAGAMMFSIQQYIVYRGDQRLTTVLPRVQAFLPETIRHEMWIIVFIIVLLMLAGVGLPFVFARLGIKASDFVDKVMEKITNFINKILHKKPVQ